MLTVPLLNVYSAHMLALLFPCTRGQPSIYPLKCHLKLPGNSNPSVLKLECVNTACECSGAVGISLGS